ncbi:LacI family DNA-binding transcriptional regulator [Brachybacterium sp. UMB0905]|uniref:LacI family DNA-binding transcriptional regulator n=1 Tax=Brachybacterium sp. UMB0905 TaxID=2069310 RepID=UPI000C808721|nr:LacI family DNA-binding transcriptional regulator [Brachybacterium sp. UMB0905]PMC76154.1 LacI family transcriptional regulator [Brachybacterium sp. UMB0905]
MTPPRRPTSADVAARAGVSRATVSMVLNGRVAGTVSTATQEKVLAAADELGYTRSALAISLRERRTRTIGLITDEIATSPFAGRMARAASLEAARADYLVITVDLSLREQSVSEAARLLAERQVDGLIYATMGHVRVPRPSIPPGIPLVLLNCALENPEDPGPPLPSFIPDDYGAARRAVSRLLEAGHRRIAMISGEDDSVAVRDREQGFRDELAAHGLDGRVLSAGWQMDDGYRAASHLLDGEDVPTGVFCIRDRVAGGALHAAAARGVSVPEGLSVVGFDDEEFFAAYLTPALTTMALPHTEMGERAMAAVLAQLESDDSATATGQPTAVACSLVERSSVAGPSGS